MINHSSIFFMNIFKTFLDNDRKSTGARSILDHLSCILIFYS